MITNYLLTNNLKINLNQLHLLHKYSPSNLRNLKQIIRILMAIMKNKHRILRFRHIEIKYLLKKMDTRRRDRHNQDFTIILLIKRRIINKKAIFMALWLRIIKVSIILANKFHNLVNRLKARLILSITVSATFRMNSTSTNKKEKHN